MPNISQVVSMPLLLELYSGEVMMLHGMSGALVQVLIMW